jgi:hypothetical protein
LRGTPKFDNGDDSVNATFVQYMAELANKEKKHNAEDIDKFEKSLFLLLKDQDRSSCHIGCDYDPDKTLCDAIKKAGLNPMDFRKTSFPWKTYMVITSKTIEVSCGYGKPMEIIYSIS